jgi:hypothetical protein
MCERFVLCLGLLEGFQTCKSWGQVWSSDIWRQAIKGVHWTLLYFCSSAPCHGVYGFASPHALHPMCCQAPCANPTEPFDHGWVPPLLETKKQLEPL